MEVRAMYDFIFRLVNCGYSPHDAYMTYRSFLKEFSEKDLILFIKALEAERD